MKMIKYARVIAASALGLTSLVLPVAAEQPTKIDFSSETVGAEPKALVAVVGIWRIESEGGKNVLAVDGRQWKEGQSSAGVADKARALYGERYAEFLDRVQAYAYYPYTVVKDVENFRGGEITVRFEGLSGRIDQGAGILFNLKPNGDYLALRANCLENNLVLWKFEKGKRSSVSWVRNAPAASKQWHDLKVRISGTKVEGYIDGKLYLTDIELPSGETAETGDVARVEILKADTYDLIGRVVEILPRAVGRSNPHTASISVPHVPPPEKLTRISMGAPLRVLG